MKDHVVLITGATSGIGKEAAKSLASKGSKVIVTARNLEKARQVKSEIESLSKSEVIIVECDLASQKSIKSCVDAVMEKTDKLDVLINNAGVWNTKFNESPDGIEETFAVNVIGPYLMFEQLRSLLIKSDEPKVITVSSGLHFGKINFNDIEHRKKFSGFNAYRQSKLAVILLTRLLAGMPENKSIAINCMHPGLVNTSLGRHGSSFFNAMFKWFGKSPEKGADTLIYVATAPEAGKITGEYFENRKVKRTTPQSYDMQTAEKLLAIVKSKITLANPGS